MNIDRIKDEIRNEATERRKKPGLLDKGRLRHKTVRLRRSSIEKFFRAFLQARHNKHDLLHFIYKLPVLGYLLNFVSYLLRLPTQIRKVREEIVNTHIELSMLEIRLHQSQAQMNASLMARIQKLESELEKKHKASS